MNQKMDVPVAVIFSYQPQGSKISPINISWNGRDYAVEKVGFHHTFRQGRTLFHVFSVVGGSMFFRLVLNTDNLFWRLEEISDGLPA